MLHEGMLSKEHLYSHHVLDMDYLSRIKYLAFFLPIVRAI